ncbi:DUF932 domain-containing protein [Mucilaginibacter sp. UC70_90]
MAHNLSYNPKTNKQSFFSVKEKAWHGLGQIVQEYPTSAQAMEFAGLNFEVEKRKLFTYDNINQQGDPDQDIIIPEVEVDNYFATVRTDTDTVLGVVGKDYHIVQNVEAFSFFDAIVGGGEGIFYETAGALGNGERIFITATLPDYIRVGKDDVIGKYLFLTTSHDGTGSITAAFTPTRIVCNNTLNIALRNCSNVINIRHTQSAQEKLKEAHKIMGMVNQLTPMLEGIYNSWTKVRIKDHELKRLIELALCPNKEVYDKLIHGKLDETSTAFKNMCDDAFEYAMVNDTQLTNATKGTVYGAFNSVTGYFQNVRNYKDDNAKVKNMFYGGTAKRKSQTAFDLCTDFVADGPGILLLN